MIDNIDRIIYFVYTLVITGLLMIISKNKTAIYTKEKGKVTINIYALTVQCICIISVVLFCAFRKIDAGVGGTDAYAYMLQFFSSTGTLTEQLQRFYGWEPLHAFSLWIVRAFTDEYRVYLIFYYILLSLLMMKCAKVFDFNKQSFLSVLALVLLSINSFNTQRNILKFQKSCR